jgi:hypothetical protein
MVRYLLFVCCLISFCATPAKGQTSPPTSIKKTIDSLPPSEINIPLQISLRPFYRLAEQSVDTVFTSPNYPTDWVVADCATRYKYRFRRSPLQVSASGTTFNLGFTGFYKIVGSTRMCVNGAVLSPWTPACQCGFEEGERRVTIGFSSSLLFQPDYVLRTKVTRTEPKALNKCTVCFWGQDITTSVMNGLKAELDLSKKAIEDSFGNVNLKPYVQQAWNKLSEVYSIPNVGYLALNPKRLHMENMNAKNDFLNINIGITATPVISLVKPEAGLTAVPNLAGAPNKDGFSIFLEAALQYDSLSRVLNSYLLHKRFDLSDGLIRNHIIVQNTEVVADTLGNLVIKMDFTGSQKGTVYFIGQPVYNHATKTIDVEGLDYDLKTNSLLLKTAKWLFNKRIVAEMKKYTSFNLTNYYDSVSRTLNGWLNKEWTKGIKGSGSVQDLKLVSVHALPEHLLIRSNCTGKLAVQVSDINLKF